MTDRPSKANPATMIEHATIDDLRAKKERQQQRANDLPAADKSDAASPPQTVASVSARPKTPRPDRVGKKLVAGYFPVETTKALKHISVDQGMTLQQVMAEAFALYLESRRARP